MLRIGVRMRLVTVGLAGLRQKNEGSGVCGLGAEGEIQEDKWVEIKVRDADSIHNNPNSDDQRLRHEEKRRAEETGEGLCLQREPIVSENRREMSMRKMKAEMVPLHRGRRHGCIHPALLMNLA